MSRIGVMNGHHAEDTSMVKNHTKADGKETEETARREQAEREGGQLSQFPRNLSKSWGQRSTVGNFSQLKARERLGFTNSTRATTLET